MKNIAAEIVANLPIPEGFALETSKEHDRWFECEVFTVTLVKYGETLKERLTEVSMVFLENKDGSYTAGSGHTSFKTSQGQFTFDRHGIDDSFHVEEGDTIEEISAKVAAQLKRVKESRERHASSEKVPVLGHVVSKETKAKYAADLKAGKSVQFTPGGMGTGHSISTRKRDRYARKLPDTVSKFFGLTVPLYDSTFDHD